MRLYITIYIEGHILFQIIIPVKTWTLFFNSSMLESFGIETSYFSLLQMILNSTISVDVSVQQHGLN